jgi:hypothetical protein
VPPRDLGLVWCNISTTRLYAWRRPEARAPAKAPTRSAPGRPSIGGGSGRLRGAP